MTESADDLAHRIAQRTLAKRGDNYANEVRCLLDAAVTVMKRSGTASRARVADIVAESGLSNDAFYRHFKSKDALVAAILEDGTARLRDYVEHQMNKETTPEGQVRRWVEGVMSQGADDVGAATRAVLWNTGSLGENSEAGPPSPSAPLASLLRAPFAELGSADPEFDANLAAHATIGILADHLYRRVAPGPRDIDRITAFCLRTAASGR